MILYYTLYILYSSKVIPNENKEMNLKAKLFQLYGQQVYKSLENSDLN